MTIFVGLTGGIGMGKSTLTAHALALGIPVVDCDAIVHEGYAPGEWGAEAIKSIDPAFIDESGRVNRQEIMKAALADPEILDIIEHALRPGLMFRIGLRMGELSKRNPQFLILDAPLLYEMGFENRLNGVIVVSCSPEEQRRRVLARPGMTEEKFDFILARQMSDQERRNRADVVIMTDGDIEQTRLDFDKALVEFALLHTNT